ncbi:ABC transporter permease [Pseudofrankia asymbiotica]|uniref:ABC transporter permease n=1 Tax=Pseudofrankia asymbiotica TaxID=1834516 RepID=A0A1V2IIT5_9ACTN|nr:ABC transporter permease [Pseudofrankia asymbiotica]ONH32386.1 ABC transporter permease [Pseudofrankia asymbiotica]
MSTAAPTVHPLDTAVKVARLHLLDRVAYLLAPAAGLLFAFTVDAIIVGMLPSGDRGDHSVGGLAAICVVAFVIGLQSITKGLSFGLSLGLSRRGYYLGTALLAITFAAVSGAILTVLRAVEGATGGWGLSMRMFRLPYILDGSWYEAWLTSFVVLTLLYVYGCWWGLVYRRWTLIGMIAFAAGQVTVVLAGALAATWTHSWSDVGHFFTTLSAVGLTGVLAAVTVALMAGGFTTLRRVTI